MITANELQVSSQRALLDAITPNMRLIAFGINDDLLISRVFFETEPSEEETELIQVSITEILADFPKINRLDTKMIVNNGDISKVKRPEVIAYARFERK